MSISIEQDKNNAIIIISDTGIGIDEKELPYIFDRFYRVEKSRTRQKGGSGLGLAIVKTIADTYNGTVSIKNNADKGITAQLSFPSKR